ncbi:sugar transferase [Paenibacillus flagellatus]|uniref:sugar transferase n=1 Tax=Paenibacillus flagellatus TaxID=2211139 RepID=UPI00248315C3|nr:sugar transferase [Paenibacillus flagellatus]
MKRMFDLTLSLLLLIGLLPLIVVIAILIRIKLGPPIVFKQLRPGFNRTPFYIYKFRTMTNACDSEGNLLSDAERLTTFGALIRKTSLDELPQLINVLKGEMSLVGPRPLLMRYLPFFSEREQRRFSVRPGITGLAQISGRNGLSWNERLELDAQYAENHSILLDIKILLISLTKVWKREGYYEVTNRQLPDLDVERCSLLTSD